MYLSPVSVAMFVYSSRLDARKEGRPKVGLLRELEENTNKKRDGVVVTVALSALISKEEQRIKADRIHFESAMIKLVN